MKSKKPAKLILKESNQADCHYAFVTKEPSGKYIHRFTTMAGWDGSGLARWKGYPSKMEKKDFKNALKNGGVPEWVADLYIKEDGFMCNQDLRKIANESNVIVYDFNQQEPWIYV